MESKNKHRSRRLIMAGVLATFALPAGLLAQKAEAQRRPPVRRPAVANWVHLGTKRVDGRRDRDTIDVNDRGKFRSLMFRVKGAPARIKNVQVRFENGSTYRATVRETFSRGERSSIIDLPGDRRNVDKVTFNYSDVGRGKNAEVALFGQR